jgi:hydrogenase maturation factor
MKPLPLGKLPPDLLAGILAGVPIDDPRVILGPGIGLDCAVVGFGDTCLVFKSDPITFASDEIGWYAVQVNANDIATTGATPRWFLVTALLPAGEATGELALEVSRQVYRACGSLGISVIGGHTEITYGIDRPIIAGTMIGEVPRDALITPEGASPGERVLLTKGIPIEGTAILAREFREQLESLLSADEVQKAADFLYSPGISVVGDARAATRAGGVTAMHDPTEGGLAGALWELAAACGHTLVVDPGSILIPALSRVICDYFEIDPLCTIASGALLLTTSPEDAPGICRALEEQGIQCADIGQVREGPPEVLESSGDSLEPLPRPARDEIARLFEGG